VVDMSELNPAARAAQASEAELNPAARAVQASEAELATVASQEPDDRGDAPVPDIPLTSKRGYASTRIAAMD
jgi:hypothetical protein